MTLQLKSNTNWSFKDRTTTVNSVLRSVAQSLTRSARSGIASSVNTLSAKALITKTLTLVAALGAGVAAPVTLAQSADTLDVLRVELPIDQQSFSNNELRLDDIINNNTYIDVDEFNLRAVELEASTRDDGEIRLKVGRYVTPPVPLPGPSEEGLLRIEAPHKGNKNWRLLIEDSVDIASLTAVLEPRSNNVSYYQQRYEPRGYAFGNDPFYRQNRTSSTFQSNWPYGWLGNDYNYNRQASHWLWLTDPRTRQLNLNPSFGNLHRHTDHCYDSFGRHLGFASFSSNGQRNDILLNRSQQRTNRGFIGSRTSSRTSQSNAELQRQQAIQRQQALLREQAQRQAAQTQQQTQRQRQQAIQRQRAQTRQRDTYRRTERTRIERRTQSRGSNMGNRSRSERRTEGGRRGAN